MSNESQPITEKPDPVIAQFLIKAADALSTPIRSFDLGDLINTTLIRKNREGRRTSQRFHPSSIPYMCDVKEAFKRVLNIWEDNQEWTVEAIKSTEGGTATHEWFQNGLMSRTGMMWGNWRCRCCGAISEACLKPHTCANTVSIAPRLGFSGSTRKCIEYHAKTADGFEYCEMRLEDTEHDVSGKIDGILVDKDTWYVLELKSTTENILSALQKSVSGDVITLKPGYDLLPMEKHVEQSAIYVGMIKQLYVDTGKWNLPPNFGGAILIYISRETLSSRGFLLPVTEHAFNRVKERVKTIRSLVEKKQPLYGQKICTSRASAPAKTCPFRLNCFPLKKAKK
jgi:hypothetical protein